MSYARNLRRKATLFKEQRDNFLSLASRGHSGRLKRIKPEKLSPQGDKCKSAQANSGRLKKLMRYEKDLNININL